MARNLTGGRYVEVAEKLSTRDFSLYMPMLQGKDGVSIKFVKERAAKHGIILEVIDAGDKVYFSLIKQMVINIPVSFGNEFQRVLKKIEHTLIAIGAASIKPQFYPEMLNRMKLDNNFIPELFNMALYQPFSVGDVLKVVNIDNHPMKKEIEVGSFGPVTSVLDGLYFVNGYWFENNEVELYHFRDSVSVDD